MGQGTKLQNIRRCLHVVKYPAALTCCVCFCPAGLLRVRRERPQQAGGRVRQARHGVVRPAAGAELGQPHVRHAHLAVPGGRRRRRQAQLQSRCCTKTATGHVSACVDARRNFTAQHKAFHMLTSELVSYICMPLRLLATTLCIYKHNVDMLQNCALDKLWPGRAAMLAQGTRHASST